LELPERELQKFIIGTISNLDQPLTPSQKGERSAMNYISGLTQQEIQQTRDEVLATSLKDLRSYSKLFSKAIEQNYVCVLGSEAKIKEDKDALRKLVNVFE
jgi:Zn-dependent M16 (insulinase) family peptidase